MKSSETLGDIPEKKYDSSVEFSSILFLFHLSVRRVSCTESEVLCTLIGSLGAWQPWEFELHHLPPGPPPTSGPPVERPGSWGLGPELPSCVGVSAPGKHFHLKLRPSMANALSLALVSCFSQCCFNENEGANAWFLWQKMCRLLLDVESAPTLGFMGLRRVWSALRSVCLCRPWHVACDLLLVGREMSRAWLLPFYWFSWDFAKIHS